MNRTASVGVIVFGGNVTSGLTNTLRSFLTQTYSDFSLAVVGDAALESEFNEARDSLPLDERFRFFSANGDAIAQCNSCIDNLNASTLLFCEPDDRFAPAFLEQAYGLFRNGRADIVVSPYDQTDFFNPVRLSVFNDGLPIDPLESVYCSYRFPRNLLISGDLAKSQGIVLEDYGAASFWLYAMKASLCSQRILYSDQVSCNHYRFEPNDSVLERASFFHGHLNDVLNAHNCFKAYAEGALKASLRSQTSEAERNQLESTILNIPSLVASNLIETLAREFASHGWMLSTEDYQLLLQKLEECGQLVPQRGHALLAKKLGYLQKTVDIALNRSDDDPLVSFVITPDCKPTVAAGHIWSLLWQDYPYYEVIVPARFKDDLGDLANMRNVRMVDTQEAGGSFKQAMLQVVSGAYICYLEDALFWTDIAVATLVTRLDNDRIDFGAVCPVQRFKKDSPTVMRLPFSPDLCTVSKRTWYNAFDNSLNNKVMRIGSLQSKGFVFSDNPQKDSKALYDTLAYRKYRDIQINCREKNDFFVSRAGYSKLQYKFIYAVHRIQHEAIQRAYARVVDEIENTIKPRLRSLVPVRKQILFFSNRGGGTLPPNLKAVYDLLPGKKVIMTETLPHSRAYLDEVVRVMEASKVIVTDDYLHELPRTVTKKNQSIIQLWHAAGAFKKFGLDCFGTSITKERQVHGRYTAVMVSSESIREIYAHAFGIPVKKVLALGTPRTDQLMDKAANLSIANAVRSRLPQIVGKKVILYSPTFRQQMSTQVVWDHRIDWHKLSEQLGDDCVMLVHKHPLEKFDLVQGTYKNVFEVDDENINDLLRVADCLVTDYSSVVFDAALLDVPMLFYCPDYDTYERDFYLKFPDDLPGEMIRRPEEIVGMALEVMDSPVNDKMARFVDTYLSACDGHSAQRIADYIKGLM